MPAALHPVPGPPRNFLNDLTTGAKELAAALRAMAANFNLNTGGSPVQDFRPGRPCACLLRDPALECPGSGMIPWPGGDRPSYRPVTEEIA